VTRSEVVAERGAVLTQAHQLLGWPEPASVLSPSGPGARAAVQAAGEKIGRSLRQMDGGEGVRVGVLTEAAENTVAPLAVVCEFPRAIPEETRLQAHRLAWNFSRTNLLVTVEPQLVRAWTCCEPPLIDRDGERVESGRTSYPGRNLIVAESEIDPENGYWRNADAVADLHWAELVSGHIFRARPRQFREEGKAYRTLLDNLREVRARLRELGLADRHTHDLLARIIFVQFLFDRKDSRGAAALDEAWLDRLHTEGSLRERHRTLANVLAHEEDTYALFRMLNHRFNGDLFPGEGIGQAWIDERDHVKKRHLQLLAEFVDARGDFATGQLSFWRRYAFDAIPLDFISSVYEEFVSADKGVGVHYTPAHLADHILDRVLPWHGEDWDLQVLDPACGSGIFLVKAYQRLVHRWKLANGPDIGVELLQRLLSNNIFGVDRDGEAVRVAAFSLYLAMCDEIDPKRLWEHPSTVFPRLRGNRLLETDFFKDDKGICTDADAGRYDVTVGNPPWGDKSLESSDAAVEWANEHGWSLANKDFGVLFLAKAGELTKPGGRVGLVQSAGALLYNSEPTARALQRRIFTEYRQVEGVMLLPPRTPLFRNVKVPACAIILRNDPPDGSSFVFECPKRQRTSEDRLLIVLDPYDVHWVQPREVIEEPWLWSALAWGGERHRALVRRLQSFPTMEELAAGGVVRTREGLNRGNRQQEQPELVGWRHLSEPTFPGTSPVRLPASLLPRNSDPFIDRAASKDLSAFALPQLLVKRSLLKEDGRFQARLVEEEPVLCEKMYVSFNGPREVLERASLVYNSNFATAFLFLTSGRFAFDRNNPNVRDLRRVPLPLESQLRVQLQDVQSDSDIHPLVYELFGLNDVERVLVEDLIHFTFADARGEDWRGHDPTHRFDGEHQEPDLYAYGAMVRRVIKAAYGDDICVRVDIVGAERAAAIPVRTVRFVVGPAVPDEMVVEALSLVAVRERLTRAYQAAREGSDGTPFLRCARVYGTETIGSIRHLTITHIKPDQMRFWTRTAALHDADEVALDLSAWAGTEELTAGAGAAGE
jgi:hypothetical protein